jgi:chromosome segregation ATPase
MPIVFKRRVRILYYNISRGDVMDDKILDLLTEMNKEIKSLKSDVNELNSLKSDMNELKSLKSDMNELKSLKSDMNELKSLKSDMNDLKSLKSDMNELKSLKSDMNELKSLKSDMNEFKTEMHNRFDKVEARLKGIGGQFELTNEPRIDEFDFIADKVNKLEKEIYLLKSRNNN